MAMAREEAEGRGDQRPTEIKMKMSRWVIDGSVGLKVQVHR